MVEKQLNKEKANANMYYNLFADKIGKFNNDENVLLIHIGNFDVISKFIVNNVNCNYFIIDQHLNGNYLKLNFPQIHFFGSKEDESIIEVLEQIDMKFDKIIMNPPYSKNLHLKILAEAIKHLNEDGTCVNLSPLRWLQDPLAKYKKSSDLKRFEDSVAKHIENIDYCDPAKLTNLFQAGMTFDIGIYTCGHKKQHFIFSKNDLILDKVMVKIKNLSKTPIEKYNGCCGCFVPVTLIDGGHKERGGGKSDFSFTRKSCHYGDYFVNGISTNGKTLEQCKADNKMCTNGNVQTWPIIKFKTENEVKNYVISTKTTFFKYIYMIEMVDVHVHPEFLPWMGDCMNPRTGLKGYESEWTNEDFYTYFNITKEEQELIEEIMERYK